MSPIPGNGSVNVGVVPMEPDQHIPGQAPSSPQDEDRIDEAAPVPRRSFNVNSSADLLNNETTKALSNASRGTSISALTIHENLDLKGGPVDFDKPRNMERLKETCKLIRNLFWAFEELEAPDGEEGRAEGSLRTDDSLRKRVSYIINHDYFTGVFLLLTVYALFGPDAACAQGHTPMNEDDKTLAVINTGVLLLFVLEELLLCIGVRGYLGSLRFWVDTLATSSIIGDSVIGTEFLQSDAFVAMRGSRLTKVLRVGGRSSKFVRFFRTIRTLQVIRLIPRLEDVLQRSMSELAFGLWHKRIRHVFKFLDSSGTGNMSEVDLCFFQTAMQVQFPVVSEAEERSSLLGRLETKVVKITHKVVDAKRLANDQYTFDALVSDFIATPAGKLSYRRCKDDILCMKESCAIVERASSRLTLKVCILVLLLLITIQLLMVSDEDVSVIQGLHQMDAMALSDQVPPNDLCHFITEEFAEVYPDSGFLLLILDGKVYWEPGCHCCDPSAAANSDRLVDIMADSSLVARTIRGTGLERHEVRDFQVFDGASNKVRSVAVFDTHKIERAMAMNNLMQTITVVILLTTLVVYFATDMRKLSNNNILHPLWDLMDDMCSLKCIEVLSEGGAQANEGMATPRTLFLRHCYSAPRIPIKCSCGQAIPVADEIKQLNSALDKLHNAMLSWSKYVPIILLKQLLEAKIEASIGCSFCEVSVVFLAIHDFKGVCEGMGPAEVLDLMGGVLDGIYSAIDNNGGTMLEFIGDEVLAIFNAPSSLSNFETHAIQACLEAQQNVVALGRTSVSLESATHRARVLAGNLGSPTRMKYGVLGDGVNLTARLKSLNTRYDTKLLASSDALNFPGAEEAFLTRPVGNLILKGRTTPTKTIEVLGQRSKAPSNVVKASEKHRAAFALFCKHEFQKAKALFSEVHDLLCPKGDCDKGDKVSRHFITLCDKYLDVPPPEEWDGSEHLTKKAF